MRSLSFVAAVAAIAGAAQADLIYAPNGLARPLDGSDELIRFDPSNPAGYEVVGSMHVPGIGFGGLDFDAGGNLWAYASFFKNTGGAAAGLYSVDPTTGLATPLGRSSQSLQDLAFNPVDGKMYGVNTQNRVTKLYTVDLSTGGVSLVGTFGGLPADQHAMSFAIDSDGRFYVHDLSQDKIFAGDGLDLAELYDLPQDTNFSQGMTIDWSRDDRGYHAAVGYGQHPHYFSQLNEFAPDGSGYVLGSPFGDELPDGLPPVEPGDLAIMPVPAPATVLSLAAAPLLLGRRRRA
ncbi:MAG TPA: hypothetical protein VFF69_16135 [Phycisphaerales bacterium]|nr:hypothetical protein [Phycisphaerales bacterium]